MHYSQFCSAISDILRKNSDPGTQFIQKALCKNNGVCPDVLFALPADSALGPVVYLEPLYDQYQKGIPMETICASVLSFLERRPPFPSSICQEILDPEFAKTRIAFRLVSQERNEELLKHIPWFPWTLPIWCPPWSTGRSFPPGTWMQIPCAPWQRKIPPFSFPLS